MVFKYLYLGIFMVLSAPLAHAADNGLIRLASPHTVEQTLDRFEQAVKSKGMRVFARIDHAAGAAAVSKPLRPTQLLIFGNPNAGTLLMQSAQSAGIDLPMKLLAWQDADGQVWIAYNDPAYLAQRHNIRDRDPVVARMHNALSGFAATAIAE